MATSGRAGEGERFETYYTELSPIRTGTVDSRKYEIYCIPKAHQEPSHYTAYAQLPEVCSCRIATNDVPPVPVTYQLNFGPTKDNWVGFGTAELTDFNYDEYNQPLSGDSRAEKFYFSEEPRHWTPDSLEDALTDWIRSVIETFDTEPDCIYCAKTHSS